MLELLESGEALSHALLLSTGSGSLSDIVSFTENVSLSLMTMSLEMLKLTPSSAVGRAYPGAQARARTADTVRTRRLASTGRCVELRRTVT